MKELKVLHLFPHYLKTSENWIFHLIKHLPFARILIASNTFLPNNFDAPNFQYIYGLKFHEEKKSNGSFFGRSLKRIGLAALKFKLARMIKKGEVDLIHAHFSFVGYQFLPLTGSKRPPYLVSFYGFDYQQLPYLYPEWNEKYRELFAKADGVICEGENGKKILAEMGCPPHKISIISLGVETSRIKPVERTKIPGELKLIQIATLTEKKGHIYTLKAFAAALKNCPDMHLTLVGNDKSGMMPGLVKFCEQEKITEKVTFISEIDFSKLHSFMKDYQVFIHPSCYSASMDCEGGAPVVLIDAQATGLPVISTMHCDIPSVVRNGKSGILVQEKNAGELALAIEKFYFMGQSDYNEFSCQARMHAETHYDCVKSGLKLRELYDSFLKS